MRPAATSMVLCTAGAAVVVPVLMLVGRSAADATPRNAAPLLRVDSTPPAWLAPGATGRVQGFAAANELLFLRAGRRTLGRAHSGPLGRISPTDRPVEVHAVVYAELEDGLLKRVRAFFDVYAAAMSLGVLPKPGTAGERAMLMLRGFGISG